MSPAGAAAERPAARKLKLPKPLAVVDEERAGGLRVLAARRPTVPMVEVRLSVPLPAGVIARPATSMVLAETLLAGTERHDRSEIAAAVERLGGTLGASHDGDRFVVGGSVLRAHLGDYLDLLAEILVEASFAPDEVRADRARIADETIIALSQPGVLASEALRRRMYPGHPVAAGLPSPATLRRVSPAALRELAGEVLPPRSSVLVLVGDFDGARTVALAEDRLGPWISASRTTDGPLAPLPPLPDVRPGPLELVDRPGSVQSNVVVGLPAPTRREPWWPAASLANLVFGGLFASRLVVNLRERRGFSYSPNSSVSHGRAGSVLTVRAAVGTEVTAAALVEMRYELARMAVSGVEEAELEAARRYAVGSLSFLVATQSGLAATLSSLANVGVEPGYLATHAKALATATKADVDAAARRLFMAPGSTTVIVGDAAATASTLSPVGAVTVTAPRHRASLRG